MQAAVAAYLDWIERGASDREPALSADFTAERDVVRRVRAVADAIGELAGLRAAAAREGSVLLGACLNELAGRFKRLGRLEDVLTGKPRNGWSARCDNAPEGSPVLTLSAVTGFRYDATAIKRTSLPVDDGAHYWLADGDLLVTRSNTPELVGHAAIYDGTPARCIYPDLMMRVPLDGSRVDTRFAWYWLQAPVVREYIISEAKGTSPTMKKISQGTLMNLPFPSAFALQDQRREVARLDSLLHRIDGVTPAQTATAEDLDFVLPGIVRQWAMQ